MFGSLTEKFQSITQSLFREKTLSEDSIAKAVREVRMALLDADVNFKVASKFVKKVKEKAIGTETTKGIKAGDQFIDIVHEELTDLMGKEEAEFSIKPPSKILLCGLQGSGKTTQAAKLAHWIQKNHKLKPLVVACDLQRPAAVLQLKTLAEQVGADFFTIEGEKNPAVVAKKALAEGADVTIFDTAGRLHIDDDLMRELEEVKNIVQPDKVLFVANAGAGQSAVETAEAFDQRVGITGVILTMLDGAARAGAAISIREVTGKPLIFEGVGERIEDLRLFHPRSMADRILGMGDIINLVKSAKEQFDEEETEKLEKKLKKANFTFDDYLKQMKAIQRMGPFKNILKMMPGVSDSAMMESSEENFYRIQAIIQSMTAGERRCRDELVPSRKRRIAKGSGSTMDDVNRLVKGFKQLKKISKDMPKLQKKFSKKGKLDQLSSFEDKHFGRFFS